MPRSRVTTDARLAAIKPLFVFSQMPRIIHRCQFDNEMGATRQSRSLLEQVTDLSKPPCPDQRCCATCFIHRCTALKHMAHILPLRSLSKCELGGL